MNNKTGKIRMIGLDLDGTVFNNDKKITPHTRKVLEAAIRQGVIVMPVTGRPEIGLPQEFLEIPGVQYALTSNGSRIIEIPSKRAVYQELIPWDTALLLLDTIRQWEGCVWEIYFDGKTYVEEGEYRIIDHPDILPALLDYIRKSRTYKKGLRERIEREHIGLEKIHMMFESTANRNEKMKELREKFPEVAVSFATTFNIEINSAKAGKGIAMRNLGKMLGISSQEIMACGDAANDWNMLEMAGFPVAMENADDQTKKKAAFVTRSNEADGVAYAIEQFVLEPVYETGPAVPEDLPEIMAIIRDTRKKLAEEGIPQWQGEYPAEADFQEDIEQKRCYVLKKEGKLLAVGTMYMEDEPTYRRIEDGNWKTEGPYGTIHRLAVLEEAKRCGIAGCLFDMMERICREHGMKSMRIDTHRKNLNMQSWVRRQGFMPCGTIYVEDGTPRDAFEKSLTGKYKAEQL